MFMSIEIRGLYICIGRNFEISLRRRGIAYGMRVHSAGVRMLQLFRGIVSCSYEVKNSCFLVEWSCCLPSKEGTLREGEWVCHEYS